MALLRDILGLGRSAQPEPWGRLHARPITAGDEAYLRCLYATSRADQMRATGWPPSRCRAFLDEQFDFQQRQWRTHHAGAQFLLLVLEGQPIGRLCWHSEPGLATLIDLCLAPAWRRRGVGGSVMTWLTQSADRWGQAIGLSVEPDSTAWRMARRFGFATLPGSEHGVYLSMRRPAAGRRDGALAGAHELTSTPDAQP